VRSLAGEWSTDQIAAFGSKDCSMQIRGVWLVELPELDALNRPDMARVKAFLTQQSERFRLQYGRRIVQTPRQCVFIGTTNSDAWLKDETGGRRFWPVRCGSINIAAIVRDRDQLWAEAVHLYRSGVPWWLEDQSIVRDAMEEQRGRYVEDVWHSGIERLIQQKESVSVPEILTCLGIETGRQDQVAANRVVRSLRAIGWERFLKRVNDGRREWRYRKMAG
jgi:putative DNA primase/helicase